MSHAPVPGDQKLSYKREAQLEYHHGRSPAAWTGSLMALAGFIIITVGAMHTPAMWVIIYIGAALVVLGGLATLVMKAQGLGSPSRDL